MVGKKFIGVLLLFFMNVGLCVSGITVHQCPSGFSGVDYIGWYNYGADCDAYNSGGVIRVDNNTPSNNFDDVCVNSDTYDDYRGLGEEYGRIWEAPAESSFCIGFSNVSGVEAAPDFTNYANYTEVTEKEDPCWNCVDYKDNGELDVCIRVDVKNRRSFFIAYAYKDGGSNKIRLYAVPVVDCINSVPDLPSTYCNGWTRYELSSCSYYNCTGECCDDWCLEGKGILKGEGYEVIEVDEGNNKDDDCDCSPESEDDDFIILGGKPSDFVYTSFESSHDYMCRKCKYEAYGYFYSSYIKQPTFEIKRCKDDSECGDYEKCVFPEDYPSYDTRNFAGNSSCSEKNLGGVKIINCGGSTKLGICLPKVSNCMQVCARMFNGYGDDDEYDCIEIAKISDKLPRKEPCSTVSVPTDISSLGYCYCVNYPGTRENVKIMSEIFGLYDANSGKVFYPEIQTGSPCDGLEECSGKSLCTFTLGVGDMDSSGCAAGSDFLSWNHPARVDCPNIYEAGIVVTADSWQISNPSKCKSLRPYFYEMFCGDLAYEDLLDHCMEKGAAHWDSLNKTWVCVPSGTPTCSDLALSTNPDFSDGIDEGDECLIFHWQDPVCMAALSTAYSQCTDASGYTTDSDEYYFVRPESTEYPTDPSWSGSVECSWYPCSSTECGNPVCMDCCFGFSYPEGPKCGPSPPHGGGGGGGGGGEGGGGGGGGGGPVSEICDNGVDDDEDGLTDCEDTTDCCSEPVCQCDPHCYAFTGGILLTCPGSVSLNQSTVTVPVSVSGGSLSDLTCDSSQGAATALGSSCEIDITGACPGPVLVTAIANVSDMCGNHSASDSCTFNIKPLVPHIKITQLNSSPDCGDDVVLELECYDSFGTITPTRGDYPTNVSWNLIGFKDWGTCASGNNPCTATVHTSKLSPFTSVKIYCSVDDYGESPGCPNGYWNPNEVGTTYTISCNGSLCFTDVSVSPKTPPICGTDVTYSVACMRNYGGGVWGLANVSDIDVTGFDTTTCGGSLNPCEGTKHVTGPFSVTVTCDYADPSCPDITKTFNLSCSNLVEDKIKLIDFSCDNVTCINKYAINKMYYCLGSLFSPISSISCPAISENMSSLTCHLTLLNNFGVDKSISVQLTLNNKTTVQNITLPANPCVSSYTLTVPVKASIGQIISGNVLIKDTSTGDIYHYVLIVSSKENVSMVVPKPVSSVPEYPSHTLIYAMLVLILWMALFAGEVKNK